MYRESIIRICRELNFPKEAADEMYGAWEAIERNGQSELWLNWLEQYDRDINMDYCAALSEIDRSAQTAGVHPYTAELLFFLLLTRRLRRLYEERGISLSVCHASCMDLHWKLMECRRIYGIWGSFVAWWFPGFFQMTRFALGRLQFELIDFPESYAGSGRKRPAHMRKAINVHVPSSGSLDIGACHQSYRYAAHFFREAFPGNEAAFFCESWLLYSPHRVFLKENSGIRRFMEDYDIYKLEESEDDLWRIFNCMYDGNPDTLPEETSLQRGYKEWLNNGHRAGFGLGMCVRTYDEIDQWA